ncbi:hypothetical protein [Saccharothrix texasensis]|uniref:Uncharacterized protein n=1 Tax=Saccharothrix texasensis TaxID=103734 RepID=A0A3N1HDX0_9PSEU|nr:hypothetical protein [Saccharothrix texasensis]ROP40708.1 hypothetical protein EDD40_6125 [Saccharothrix texasensis]
MGGNYPEPGTDQNKSFAWIGRFLPSDTNLDGSPPQSGVVFLRDQAGPTSYAFALYDHAPDGGGGLRQTIHLNDGNDKPVMTESRVQGGLAFPSTATGWTARDARIWPRTDQATYEDLWETHLPVTGARLHGYLEGGSFSGATGELVLRVEAFYLGGPATVASPALAIPAGARPLVAIELDVSAFVGTLAKVKVVGRRTSAAGEVGGIPLGVHCRSTA